MPIRRTKEPAVSVVMSVLNGERYLREAVESVLSQTLGDFELVAVDDGSDDASAEILDEYAAEDRRVLVHRKTNRGQASGRNLAVGLAKASLIACLDSDDVLLPDRLENQCRFLAEHGAVALVGGAVTFVDGDGRPFADWTYPVRDADIRRALTRTNPFAHSAVTVRKSVLQAAGGYRSAFVPSEDLDLWLRIAANHELSNLAEIVARYRVHPGQETVTKIELQTIRALAARVAAREREAGRPDPFDAADSIEEEALRALGVPEEQITSSLVQDALWLAKTTGRAGYAETADELFRAAASRAGTESGSRTLVAQVRLGRAQREAELGHRLRARILRVRAIATERFAR
jgi:glycosyltransferase involved in cell wall biosynthesis